MYSSWFLEFFKGPEDSFLNTWNLFDLVVVLVSGISLLFPDMPGISVLRLFRAFRVFRLFKRIPSLQRIVNGVFQSLPAVSNAFLVLLVIMGIWSIMGVEFFAEDMPDRFGTFMQVGAERGTHAGGGGGAQGLRTSGGAQWPQAH